MAAQEKRVPDLPVANSVSVSDRLVAVSNTSGNAVTQQVPVTLLLDKAKPSVVTVANTTYTFLTADLENHVKFTASANVVATVPPDSSLSSPVAGASIEVEQNGAGQVTFANGAGVTINTPETLKLKKRYASALLRRTANNTWLLMGYLEASP